MTQLERRNAIEAGKEIIKKHDQFITELDAQVKTIWASIKDFKDGNSYERVEKEGKKIAELKKEIEKSKKERAKAAERVDLLEKFMY